MSEELIISQEDLETLMAYLDVATTGSGEIMLQDLRVNFHDMSNPGLEEELSQFPHPYRAYVETGLRMAYKKIAMVIELAEQINAGTVTAITNPTDGENYESET